MENASNALMIAGGVLIGVLLVSIIVVAFYGASNLAKSYDTNISEMSVQAFNENFEQYQNVDVDIHDIISLAHFAKDYNIKNDLSKTDSIYIKVKCEIDSGAKEELQEKTDKQLFEELLGVGTNKNYDPTQKYKCKEIKYNKDTKIVTEITFEKVK